MLKMVSSYSGETIRRLNTLLSVILLHYISKIFTICSQKSSTTELGNVGTITLTFISSEDYFSMSFKLLQEMKLPSFTFRFVSPP
jgi:hypothetical protein